MGSPEDNECRPRLSRPGRRGVGPRKPTTHRSTRTTPTARTTRTIDEDEEDEEEDEDDDEEDEDEEDDELEAEDAGEEKCIARRRIVAGVLDRAAVEPL